MNPLLSIVIPVYGTEKYLERCLDSVLEQSYKNIEVIVVDDCSTGREVEIISKYKENDSRIRSVRNGKNLGLFHSRLVGSDLASGKYICFLDSDDYVAVDGYRRLIKLAEDTQTQIVCGATVIHDESKDEMYYFDKSNITPKLLEGEELVKSFFSQKGLNFSWHTVWNKIYNFDLWKTARPYYDKLVDHTIMTEDVAFSVVLFSKASSFQSVQDDLVFYVQNDGASTSAGSCEKFKKNIDDIGRVFDFCESFLNENVNDELVLSDFEEWKLLYSRLWVDQIYDSPFSNKEKHFLNERIKVNLGVKALSRSVSDDHYFYSSKKYWDDRYENVAKNLLDQRYQVVSFDIFDTLVCRPLMQPDVLFDLVELGLDIKGKLAGGGFRKQRINAEDSARKKLFLSSKQNEDITLDDIYEEMNLSGMSSDLCLQAKRVEVELEKRLCSPRHSAVKLFDMCKHLEKRVILTSDMYLPVNTIENILENCGIKNYDQLYLSNEVGLMKATGSLFKYVLTSENISADFLIHVGDSWESDVVKAKENKIKNAIHFPKAVDSFKRDFSSFAGFSQGSQCNNDMGLVDYSYMYENLFMNACVGLAVNTIYDNPYNVICMGEGFSSELKVWGILCCGIHNLAIAKWILDSKADSQKVHFIARDGYAPMLSYKNLTKAYDVFDNSNYLYVSRKSLISSLIKEKSDFYCLPQYMNVYNLTLIEFFELVLRRKPTKQEEDALLHSGIGMKDEIRDWTTYSKVLECLFSLDFCIDDMMSYQKDVIGYLDIVNDGDIIFDVGYSATTQAILSFMGKKVDGLYVHTNRDKPYRISDSNGIKVNTFYDFSPMMSGSIREFLMSSSEGSCISYRKYGDSIKPILESSADYQEKEVMNTILYWSEYFSEKMSESFGSLLKKFHINKIESSLFYESLLHYPSNSAREVFNIVKFEDDLCQSYSDKTLSDIWYEELGRKGFINKKVSEVGGGSLDFQNFDRILRSGAPKWKRALIFFLIYPKVFCEKVKIKLGF